MRIPLADALLDVPGRLLHQADDLRILAKAGLIARSAPTRSRGWRSLTRAGAPSPAALLAVGTTRHGERKMLADELGSLTYADVERRANEAATAGPSRHRRRTGD
jgi:hypothetical protein